MNEKTAGPNNQVSLIDQSSYANSPLSDADLQRQSLSNALPNLKRLHSKKNDPQKKSEELEELILQCKALGIKVDLNSSLYDITFKLIEFLRSTHTPERFDYTIPGNRVRQNNIWAIGRYAEDTALFNAIGYKEIQDCLMPIQRSSKSVDSIKTNEKVRYFSADEAKNITLNNSVTACENTLFNDAIEVNQATSNNQSMNAAQANGNDQPKRGHQSKYGDNSMSDQATGNFRQTLARSGRSLSPLPHEIIKIENCFSENVKVLPLNSGAEGQLQLYNKESGIGFETRALSIYGLKKFISSLQGLLNGENRGIDEDVAIKMGITDINTLRRLISDPVKLAEKIIDKTENLLKIYIEEVIKSNTREDMADEKEMINSILQTNQEIDNYYKSKKEGRY